MIGLLRLAASDRNSALLTVHFGKSSMSTSIQMICDYPSVVNNMIDQVRLVALRELASWRTIEHSLPLIPALLDMALERT